MDIRLYRDPGGLIPAIEYMEIAMMWRGLIGLTDNLRGQVWMPTCTIQRLTPEGRPMSLCAEMTQAVPADGEGANVSMNSTFEGVGSLAVE